LRFWRESSLIIPKTTTRHTGTESPSRAVKPDPIDNPIQLLSDGPLRARIRPRMRFLFGKCSIKLLACLLFCLACRTKAALGSRSLLG
jgi:hypothetical protein